MRAERHRIVCFKIARFMRWELPLKITNTTPRDRCADGSLERGDPGGPVTGGTGPEPGALGSQMGRDLGEVAWGAALPGCPAKVTGSPPGQRWPHSHCPASFVLFGSPSHDSVQTYHPPAAVWPPGTWADLTHASGGRRQPRQEGRQDGGVWPILGHHPLRTGLPQPQQPGPAHSPLPALSPQSLNLQPWAEQQGDPL